MLIKETIQGYCSDCGTSYDQKEHGDFKKCIECGNTTLVLGQNFLRESEEKNSRILCTCLNAEFNLVMHMNWTDHASYMYKCKKCNNHISLHIARDSYT